MKIITNDAVYVQKSDVFFLKNANLSIPASVSNKIFSNETSTNGSCDFIKFVDSSAIEYFKKLDWVVDYNQIKDLNQLQIVNLLWVIMEQRNIIMDSMPVEQCKSKEQMICQCNELDCKLSSLRYMLLCKQGDLKFLLPEGISYSFKSRKKLFKGLKTYKY